MANRCPNKSSLEWKVLVSQVGEDTAWATWQFHKFDFPLSITNTSTIKKEIGLRNGLSELQLAMMAKRLEKYNAKHGTSHSFDKNKVGEADLYNPILKVSYFPKKITQKIIEDGNMQVIGKDTAKSFINTNPKLFIQGGNQFFKDGEIFSTIEDALYDEDYLPTQIKEGVNFVFEQNPELANAVYEALGFKIKSLNTLEDLPELKKKLQEAGFDIDYRMSYERIEEDLKEGLGYVLIHDGLDGGRLSYNRREKTIKLWFTNGLEKADNELRIKANKIFNGEITLQQKQQAQQIYSQYLDTKQPDVILPIGTSGSGKSTFIKSLPQENLVVIEPDAMRVEFTGNMNDKSKDKEIYEEAAKRAVKAIKAGKQVVFDTTNLTKDKRLPFIEAIKKEIPTANIQYKLMELNPELAKQRIKAQIERGENRAVVSDETIDRHAVSYKQMLKDIKNEPITEYKELGSKQDIEGFKQFIKGNESDYLPNSIIGDKKNLKPKFQELADSYVEKAKLLKESVRKLKIQEKKSVDPTEKIQLNKRIEILENRINDILGVEGDIDKKGIINDILKLNALEDIDVYAEDQLSSVEDIFKKDNISKEEADFARKVVGLWLKAGDFSTEENLFWDKEDLEDIANNEVLRKVKSKFNEYRNRAEDIQRNYIFPMELQLVEESFGKFNKLDEFDVNISGILNQPIKDVNWATKEMLDFSEVNHPLAQLMSNYLKRATFGAHQESIVINDEVDRLISKIDKIDWELFQQTFSNTDDRKTGNLVFRFSQEYFDTVKQLFNIAKATPPGKSKNKAYKEAIDFIRKNSLIFDVRKLFADKELWGVEYSQEEVDAHIKELKEALGEIGYQQYYERAEEKVEKFKVAREAQREYYEDVVFKDNPALAQAALQQWEANNSPAAEAELVEKGYPVIKVNENYVMPSGQFSVKIPKRTINGKDTGFYDKKFEKIESDENLRNLYNHVFNTLNELKQYLPHQQIDWMQVNSLPTMYNTVVEEYAKSGMNSMLKPLKDSLTEAVRMSDLNTIDSRIINPLTGEPDKHLQTQMLINYNSQINKLVDLKIIEYKQNNNNKEPNAAQIVEFKKDAADELTKLKTFDLGKITKAYALMALTYKHKSSVQDVIEASNNILKRQMEQQENNAGKALVDKFGNPRKVEGLAHLKEMMNTFMDTYYGYSMDKPFGQGKKIYTSREKELKDRLDIAIQKNKSSLENNEITEEEYKAIDDILQDQLDLLGGVRTWSKYGDLVLQYVQLKGMGWNVFAGITNMTYGFVANITEASDGRNYTMKEFWKAQAKVLHTIGGVNRFSTEAKKIQALIKNLDTLKVSRYELYASTTPGTMGKLSKKLKVLNPYNPQTSTEYINQATVLVAMMLHQKVKVNGKETNLYDAYDNEGKLVEGVEFPNNLDETEVKINIDRVIKMNHGNYDPDTSINAKRHLLGRALSQFRTWAFQGFAERFMEEMPDYQLGIVRKGRYRSFSSFYKAQKEEKGVGWINSTFFLTKQLMRKATFGRYNTQFDEIQGLSETDAANMRKNMTEIMTYIMLTIFALMLKTMFDDSEKSKAKYIAFFWINQLTRLNTDMSFYVSPVQFEKLTRNAMPAFTAVIDTEKALRASWNFIFDNNNDILQSGRNKGESKAKVAISKIIPNPMNAIDRVEAASTQVFSNKPNQ